MNIKPKVIGTMIIILIVAFFLLPYYSSMQLFGENLEIINLGDTSIRVKIRIYNKGLLDVTIRSIQLEYAIKAVDHRGNPVEKTFLFSQLDLFTSGLPFEMITETGFNLRSNSYRDYEIYFSNNELLKINLNIVNYINLILNGEVTCLWYTRRLNITIKIM